VDAGGYSDRRLWTEAGWAWRTAENAEHPRYWQRAEGGDWQVRRFQETVPLAPHAPVIHVSWHEAEAFCRWSNRRLPTEAEWELAAGGFDKRRFPWGDTPPGPEHANLDLRLGGPVDVAAFPAGDSPFGCRQMIGNVWEWTSTRFLPYPGFTADPYKEYSVPWFLSPHMVLRGGCFVTRGRLLRTTWRNFYPPHRSDVLAGFRTCAPR
jgi:iron(II)-dependent oxidoreductase